MKQSWWEIKSVGIRYEQHQTLISRHNKTHYGNQNVGMQNHARCLTSLLWHKKKNGRPILSTADNHEIGEREKKTQKFSSSKSLEFLCRFA